MSTVPSDRLHQRWYTQSSKSFMRNYRRHSHARWRPRRESNAELANTFKELGIDLSACVEVVYLFLFEKWSISSISSKIGITWSKIRYIIRTYKSRSRISKTLNRTESYKSRQKLSDDHIEWIRDLVRKNSGDIITNSKVRQKLLSTFPEVGSISSTTVRRYLKMKWNLTYK